MQVVGGLVRLDADQRGLDPVHRPVPVLQLDVAQRVGELLAQPRVEEAPEREAPADEVLPEPALRLVQPERGPARERRPFERGRDAVLVEAVPALVHRREEPVEVRLVVARREPDVLDPQRARERVDGRIEPPGPGVESEALEHGQLEAPLALERIGPVAGGPFAVVGGAGDERHLLRLQPVEHDPHLGRRHAALEVVEQHVVRLVVAVEAVDVAPPQVQVGAQVRQEAREVRLGPCLRPHGQRQRRRPRHVRPELRGHLSRLLPVAPRHADQARLVGVVVLRFLERREPVEQEADLVRDEPLVREPVERRELLRPHRAAALGHLHLLVPGEQRAGLLQVVDLAQALLQLGVVRVHTRHRTSPPERPPRVVVLVDKSHRSRL